MKFLHLPKLYHPADLPERMARQQMRPLLICLSCGYALANCGHCHNSACTQSVEQCAYIAGAPLASSEEGDRVWCEECQGFYLAHSHEVCRLVSSYRATGS